MNYLKNSVSLPVPESAEIEIADYIPIPVDRYEDLIRAETELNVLEAAIDKGTWATEEVLAAIRKAREKVGLKHCCEIRFEADPAAKTGEEATTDAEQDLPNGSADP